MTGDRFLLPQGSYAADTIQVRQTDGAGNVSESGSIAEAISVVTTPPPAPIATLIGDGPITNDATVDVDGILDGATWEYSINGGTTWLAGTGASFELPEGSYAAGTVQVRQTDGAGNVSTPARVGAVVIDLTAPESPTATLADESPITNDGTVNVGNLEPEAIWEYSLDGGDSWLIGTGTSFTLPQGDYGIGDVQVRQTDRAGNVSESFELGVAVTIDVSAPEAPIATLALEGELINDGTVSVTGIEEDAFWEYSLDGGSNWLVGEGDSFTLPDGPYALDDIQVRQTDPAGNVSPLATLGPVVIDTIPPQAPTLTLANDTGVEGDGITADGTILVGGLEPGATWQYRLDTDGAWIDGNNGSFILPEGVYTAGQIQARQFDAAGNVSEVAEFGAITVDLNIEPPTPVEAPTLALAEDTGAVDGITSNGTVNVLGLVEGATWEYSTDGGDSWTDGTDASFELVDGTYPAGSVLVRQTLGEITSAPRTLETVTIDTTAPAAPTLTLATNTGVDDDVTSDGTVLVNGLEEGASWEYSTDGGDTWTAGTGTNFILPEGVYVDGQVLARQTDIAGNQSLEGELAPIVVDVTSPGGENGTDAPFIALPALINGFINAEAADEGIELGVMLTPGTQAGDTLTVTLTGGGETLEFDYTVTDEDVTAGAMSVVLESETALLDAGYSVSAQITDGAGSGSAVSNVIGFVLDTVAPNDATTFIEVAPITADNIINIAESGRSVEIRGRVDGEFRAGDELLITVGDGEYRTTVGADGAFNVAVLGSLLASATPPEVSFALAARDAAGNVGTIVDTADYTVDLSTPTVTIDPLTGDNIVNAQNIANGLEVTGTVEGAPVGAPVTLAIAGATFEGVVENGSWSVSIPASFLRDIDGNTVELVATVANEVGNVGASAPVDVVIDTLAPTATIAISDTLIGAGDEALVTFTFSEPIENFTLADVAVTGGTLVDLASENGTVWTATFQPGAVSGPASITLAGASYTDLAGNPGQPASLDDITVDIDRPSLESISFAVQGRPLTSQETTEVTFSFSEPVTGLALGDFTVTGGRLSNLSSVNGGATWTATFRPDGTATSASITLENGSFTDLAGNPGIGSTSPGLDIDILQPVLVIEAADDGWINEVEATSAEVQVGFGGLSVQEGEIVTLEVIARPGGELAEGVSIATLTYTLTAADVANGFATFSLDIPTEYAFQPASAQVQIGGSAGSMDVDFVLDTIPPGRAVDEGVEVAGNGILLGTLFNPGEGIRLRIEDNEDTVRILDTDDYPGLLSQNASGQFVIDLFVLALNLGELLGDDLGDLLDLRSLDLQLSSFDAAGNEGEIVTLNDFNILGPVVSLLDFTGSLIGVTDPGATVQLDVRLAGVTQTLTVGSDENGQFAVNLLADPRLSFSLNDLLQASITAVATDAQGNRSVSPVNANLVDLLPVPLSTLDLSPLTDLVVGGAGVVPSLTNIVLPEGSTLTATLDVSGLAGVNVPLSNNPNGTLSLNVGAALGSAVTSLNLLGGVAGLLSGRGVGLTLEYTSPEGVVGTTEVRLLGGSLATLTFGSAGETTVIGTPESDVLIVGAGQSIEARGGDDLIVLRSADFVSIDGGAGTNTLLVEQGLTLELADFARMSNVQRLNLGTSGSTVQLDAETASALAGDGGSLQIIGGASNSLLITGAASSMGTVVVDGVTYQQITLGDTSVLVSPEVGLDYVPTINQTAGYIISGGGEAGAAVVITVGSTTYNTQVNGEGDWRLVLDQPATAGSQIRAVVGGDITETVSVPTLVAAPSGLQIRTPSALGNILNLVAQPPLLEGNAPGANSVRMDVYQNDLFTSLNSATIAVGSNGGFSTNASLINTLLSDVTGFLLGGQGVSVGFTALRNDGSQSTTEVVNIGSAESVLANPTGALNNLLGGVLGGVVGRTDPLTVNTSFYDGSDRADLVQGSARNQTFTTEDGNDVVISTGGADVISTGTGDDVIVLRSTQFASIDGGDGFDIVALGTGINLNLTSSTIGEISNVERIALGRNNGANTLRLGRQELIELTDDDNVLQVTGGGQDRVELAGGSWSRSAGTQTVDGVVFNEYTNQDVILLIEQTINNVAEVS
ncbi:Ig-like domain-containing protein [Halomonas sp. HNIBRBA4712]|uniref:Ig-like domain-containing protein n=1 Tax=Halomonas sp. HNIBRBA4712 TaxID=3373087 RepID=UPI003745747A